MSASKDAAVLAAGSTIPVHDFANRFHDDLLPLNNSFSYFFLAAQPTDEERKEFLEEPVSALPPKIVDLVKPVNILFVPFLEKAAKTGSGAGDLVSLVRPAKPIPVACTISPKARTILFPFEDRDIGEHHYRFFQAIGTLVAGNLPSDIDRDYLALIRSELRANIHGEVDDAGWDLKLRLSEKPAPLHRSTKLLREYARQSFIDTLTLYLHGICCDLDVDTGPRQLASRHLRRRLELLEAAFPPPEGYAVFPEKLRDS